MQAGTSVNNAAQLVTDDVKSITKPTKGDEKEVFNCTKNDATLPSASTARSDIPRVNQNGNSHTKSTEKINEPIVALEDPEDAVVLPGAVCKRKGCGQQFVSVDESRKDGARATCQHHPGAPVFHEGSKGWSCCSRRVLEFDEFLRIKGCEQGKHMFLDPVMNNNSVATNGTITTNSAPQKYRRDWYQTREQVIVSVYAKKLDKKTTKVHFDQLAFTVDLTFSDNSISSHSMSIDTYLPINATESTFEVLSTKIEIVLKKASGISWPSLEPAEVDVKDWTTFGAVGSKGGTVGGKEMYLATDAPIYAQHG